MDDKQIIIDGVNIKDCKRRIGKDNYCRYYKRPCSENNFNCIWKKYLRKEQECEKLKKQVEVFTRQLEKANKEVITEKEKNATSDKYKKQIKFDGFEKYEGKAKPKKEEVEEDALPF